MNDFPEEPKLYRELASWWPLLSPPEDYAAEAEHYREVILSECDRRPETMLELGCGGGNNASHLRQHFQMTLVDLSPDMLAVSRALNPGCEHRRGDMRSVRVGREFDAVFIHDAVAYMTSEADLRRCIETAFVHCRPGGVALFAPDHVRETFRPATSHGGHDGTDRSMRYLEWIWDPDPADTTHLVDFAYLLRESGGPVRCEQDRHVCGLFGWRQWIAWIGAAGFRACRVGSDLRKSIPGLADAFLGIKPSDAS